jgi:hypothetical protein
VHLVGFIIKKFVTMHGHMNVGVHYNYKVFFQLLEYYCLSGQVDSEMTDHILTQEILSHSVNFESCS